MIDEYKLMWEVTKRFFAALALFLPVSFIIALPMAIVGYVMARYDPKNPNNKPKSRNKK